MRSYSDLKKLADLSEMSVNWINREMSKVEEDISKLLSSKKRTKKQEKELEKLILGYKSLLNKTNFELSIIDKLIKEINEHGEEE